MLKIGIIREGKTPPDARVPLTPKQCAFMMHNYPVHIVVEPSPIRCFTDAEYTEQGVTLSHDLSDCDVLMGVKEVPKDQLIANKTYFFFSHTIKEQPFNRSLLQTILKKQIHLIDYEVLTNEEGERLIAFGKFAGIVGAHNAIWTYGKQTGAFDMKRMIECHDYAEALQMYKTLKLPPIKIVLTGTGRVAMGAQMVLHHLGIWEVSPYDYLHKSYDEIVFTQLNCSHYVRRKDDGGFQKSEFYQHPERYESSFAPYAQVSDVFINGIYWNNSSPQFFTLEDMQQADFRIKVIADVTCDIAPASSVPSTLRASTIADPVYGFDTRSQQEVPAFSPDCIDVMAIDNLPNELPRDASQFFGEQFIKNILDPLLEGPNNPIIARGSVTTKDGDLGRHFDYLRNYAMGS